MQTKKQIQNRRNYERRKFATKFSHLTNRVEDVLWLILDILIPKRLRKRVGELAKRIDSLEKLLLIGFIGGLVWFSIQESIAFLSEAENDHAGILLKAILTESIIMTFSWLTFEKKLFQAMKVLLIVGSCLYSLFTTSGRVLFAGSKSFESSSTIQQSILDLKVELSEKAKLRTEYMQTKRLAAARILDSKIDQLQDKLENFRHESIKSKTPLLVESTTLSLIFFRVLVLVANILAVHKLAELFGTSHSSSLRRFQSKLILVKG